MRQIIVAALMFASALAATQYVSGKLWYNYFDGTATTPSTYHYALYDYEPSTAKQSNVDKGKYMQNKFCYAFYYDTLSCAGEPLVFGGALSGSSFSGMGTTYRYYFNEMYDSVMGYNTATPPVYPQNVPIGCTDIFYLDTTDVGTSLPNKSPNPTVLSVLFMCPSTKSTGKRLELPCPRNCKAKACGELDGCGVPCVGSCATGQYCDTTGPKFQCKTAHYGSVSMFLQFEFPSRNWVAEIKQRDYVVPTFTHLENALVQDIELQSGGELSRDAIVIKDYEFYGLNAGRMNAELVINVDQANLKSGKTYSIAEMENRIKTAYLDSPCYGPLTQFIASVGPVFTSEAAGDGRTSTATTTSDEWVPLINIHSSWLIEESSEGVASTVAVCWAMLVSAILAVIAW